MIENQKILKTVASSCRQFQYLKRDGGGDQFEVKREAMRKELSI